MYPDQYQIIFLTCVISASVLVLFYIGAGRSGRGISWRNGIGTARSSGCGQNHFRDSAVLLPYGS